MDIELVLGELSSDNIIIGQYFKSDSLLLYKSEVNIELNEIDNRNQQQFHPIPMVTMNAAQGLGLFDLLLILQLEMSLFSMALSSLDDPTTVTPGMVTFSEMMQFHEEIVSSMAGSVAQKNQLIDGLESKLGFIKGFRKLVKSITKTINDIFHML